MYIYIRQKMSFKNVCVHTHTRTHSSIRGFQTHDDNSLSQFSHACNDNLSFLIVSFFWLILPSRGIFRTATARR